MDNKPADDVMKQLGEMIHHEVEHSLEHAMTSPILLNRTIGEAMRHIGSALSQVSGNYLPLDPREILVAPVQMSETDRRAVVLINRSIDSQNAFRVVAHVSETREININSFQPDEFNMSKSQFFVLNDAIMTEVKRQISELVKAKGFIYVQCVLLTDYFPEAQAVVEETPAQPEVPAVPVAALPAVKEPAPVSKLPAVDVGNLL